MSVSGVRLQRRLCFRMKVTAGLWHYLPPLFTSLRWHIKRETDNHTYRYRAAAVSPSISFRCLPGSFSSLLPPSPHSLPSFQLSDGNGWHICVLNPGLWRLQRGTPTVSKDQDDSSHNPCLDRVLGSCHSCFFCSFLALAVPWCCTSFVLGNLNGYTGV